ncbi:hypothetical protein BESB_063440 [Besnoitia besnoiti]|uniref:Transmembrane protein n=1 Tax=Besnoitia besnoiti TaxID=94643 RepID=A0A2A9MIP3_BESBE|nr:hypothetical protein BESB_063440 [Besnoitia besnoiti]PFH35457.1 hypothetical protein BESB_063440 [Besnoitia besnoiti]
MGYSSHGCRTEVSSSAASQHPLRLRHALQTLCAATSPSSAESRVTGRGLSVRSPLASSARSSCLSSSKLATSSRSSPPASRAYSCPRVASFVFPSSSVEMPARAGARDLQCDEAPVFSQADPSRGGATPRPASCVESPQAAASMGRLSRLSSPQALRATARRGALRVVASACALLFVFLLSWAVSPSPPAPPASFPVWLPSVAPVSAAPARSQQLKIGPAQVLLPSPPPAPDARVATPLVSVRTLLIVEQNGASLSSSSSSPCFYWTAQHPDTIRLLRPDCAPSQLSSACLLPSSSSAALSSPQAAPALCLPRVLVEAAVPAPHRRGRSWIFASPTAQGGAGGRAAAASGVAPSAMRVQAVVAPIARLAFRTRDRRLAVGQLGDVGVLAFDEEGNIFTSLQGLVFLWRFEGEKGVLQAEPITGDAEAATPTRRWVEKTSEKAAGAGARARTADSAGGLVGAGSAGPFWRSDMLLVRGLKTGRATIIVRLAGEYYQHVGEARVSFVVHEPVLLLPSFQVLPPAAVFQYRLLRLREQAESQAGTGFPRALRGPSYVELPAPHWQFSATDLAVYDAQDRLPLERATDAASAASSLVSIDPSGLLRVVAPPAFPGEGEQATRFGLEGATLLRAVDMRTGEEQHAKVFVLQPSALRLFVDDIQALRQQDVWRQLVLAVRRQMGRSAGADSKRGPHSRTARAEETHASELLLLSKLAERAWAAPPAGDGRQPEDEQAEGAALGDDSLGVPPTELLMSLVKTGGEAEGHDDDVLYLVRGREYLCKVEMLAASLSQGFAPLSDAAGDPRVQRPRRPPRTARPQQPRASSEPRVSSGMPSGMRSSSSSRRRKTLSSTGVARAKRTRRTRAGSAETEGMEELSEVSGSAETPAAFRGRAAPSR